METFSNESSNVTLRTFKEDPNTLVNALLVAYVLAAILLGTVGNSLTAYTILSVKSLRTTSNVLVASLAVTDIFAVLVSIPILYSRMRFPGFYQDHGILCNASYYVIVIFVLVSVNHLQVIAANRYFIITRPRHVYNRYWGKLGTGVILGAVWGYCVTLTCLPFVGFGKIEYIPELGGCGIVETDTLSWWYKTVLLLLVVESCGIATPLFFALTFRKIRAVQRRIKVGATDGPGQATNTAQRAKTGGLSRQELAITKMTVTSFLCFILCWSPYLVLHVLTIGREKPGGLASFLLIFAFSSSVFNPIIYAGMNKNFRRAFFLTKLVFHYTATSENSATVTEDAVN